MLVISIAAITFSQSEGVAKCITPATDGEGLQSCLDSSAAGDTNVLQLESYVPREDSNWIINNSNFLNNTAINVSGY